MLKVFEASALAPAMGMAFVIAMFDVITLHLSRSDSERILDDRRWFLSDRSVVWQAQGDCPHGSMPLVSADNDGIIFENHCIPEHRLSDPRRRCSRLFPPGMISPMRKVRCRDDPMKLDAVIITTAKLSGNRKVVSWDNEEP